METKFTRPGFLAAYFGAMTDRANAEGWSALIPVWLLVSGCVGCFAVYFLPDDLWSTQNWQTIIAVYAALITMNGLLLALSWSAFSRIHDLMISSVDFAIFLRQAKLFEKYLFYIDWIQASQLLALIVSAASMFSSISTGMPIIAHRVVLGCSVAFSFYAIRFAANAVTVMHDLVWQRSIFEEQEAEERSKIVSFGKNNPRRDGDRS